MKKLLSLLSAVLFAGSAWANPATDQMMGSGISDQSAIVLNQLFTEISGTATAAGSTLGTATALVAGFTNVTTVAASTGVRLIPPFLTGQSASPFECVRNGGANDLKVYPDNGSSAINGGSAGAAITLTTASKQITCCWYQSATQWICLAPMTGT